MSVCDQDVMLDVPLYVIAHSRSGDKGNVSNISLVAYQPAGYELLIDQVTPERLQQWFRFREPARITRYMLPQLYALNIVLEGVLDGGVNRALNLDAHGKALSFYLLDMHVQLSASQLGQLSGIADPGQYVRTSTKTLTT